MKFCRPFCLFLKFNDESISLRHLVSVCLFKCVFINVKHCAASVNDGLIFGVTFQVVGHFFFLCHYFEGRIYFFNSIMSIL